MRVPALAVLVTGTLVWSGLTGTASAAPYPSGFLCGFDAEEGQDPAGPVTGQVDATLLLTDDTIPAPLYTGSVTCLVRVDGAVQDFTGATRVGLAAVAASVTVDRGADVSLCTRVDIDGGGQLYYDGSTWVSASACPYWMPVVV